MKPKMLSPLSLAQPHPKRRNRLGIRSLLLLLLSSLLFWSSLVPSTQARSVSPAASSIQPYLDRVVERVTKFTLDNGVKFLILENHQAPVVSFVTYADVGGVDEPEGKTGVAHFLEHLAFKGTTRIGTSNYQAEKPLLESLDRLDEQIQAAKAAGKAQTAAQLQETFNRTEAEASQLVRQNEFGRIVETAGGVSLNAATSADYTQYFYNFPANKLELWMSLESERFLDPVFREFYKEREVILEERRLRTDNSPIGKMLEAFLNAAFTQHPYQRPVIGYEEDIRNLTREDVQSFFETYYTPGNLTVAIVGDVNPVEVKRLAQIYFGRYPAKPAPPDVTALEPPQTQARSVTVEFPSQPWYLEGYHRPALTHPDHAVYEAIATLMSDGRTSRLYRSLVEEKQVALAAQGFSGFPGEKFANMVLFYALTAPNSNVDAVAAALAAEIQRLKEEPVSPQELSRVKQQLRANLLRQLDSNGGMARLLVKYEVLTGDWRNLFAELEAIAAVSDADIQRVARATFTAENRTIGRLLPPSNTEKAPNPAAAN